MLEAIVIHRSFPRQLASLLSLLLLVFTVAPARALEIPPNILWHRDLTSAAHTNTTLHLTDCKLLSNGNLAITGQFTGTDPILGSPHQSGQDPTNGTFVALQSPAGDLLWLHRFDGASFAELAADDQDNIHLANYSKTAVSVLGTNLPAEPEATLVYALSLKPDGSLNHLRRLGKMDALDDYFQSLLQTSCQPVSDGLLVSLEFQETLQLGGNSYTASVDAASALRFKFTAQNEVSWLHHFDATYLAKLGPVAPLTEGAYLSCINFFGPASFQGQTYPADVNIAHSLMVWHDSAGQVTKTARVTGTNGKSVRISGVTLAADGYLFLQVSARGAPGIRLQPPVGDPLLVSLPGEPDDDYDNITIIRVSPDLSDLRWQIGSELGGLLAFNNLQSDQAGNLYAAFFLLYHRTVFGGQLLTPFIQSAQTKTVLVKLSPTGQLLWIRDEKSSFSTGFDVAPDGTSYLVSDKTYQGDPARVVSIGASLDTSPPEFKGLSLTNQLAPSGSTLYFTPPVSGNNSTVYYWFKDGALVTNSPASRLLISNLSAAHLGSYTILASNQFGTATSGPYTFKLGPPSKLAEAELLQHIKTPSLAGLWTYFSPDGRYHLCTFGSQSEFELNSAIYPAIPYRLYCQTAARGDTPRVFPIDYPTNALFPSALIANDGSCIFMASYRAGPANQQYSRHWLRRTDSTGNTLWELDVASATSWQFHGMSIHQNTNLVLLAYCKQGTALGTPPPVTQSGLYLVRISFAGEVLDTKLLLLGEDLYAGMYLASDGSGYLQTTSPATIPGGETIPTVAGHFHLFRFDADGQISWFRRLPQPDEYNMAIANDADGVVLGITYRDQVEVSGLPALNFQDQGVLVIRWSKDGHLEWHKVLDTPGWDYVRALDVDAGGNVIFGLMTTNEFTMDGLTVPANPQNFEQPVLVTLSRAGIMSDALRLSASGPLVISDLAIDPTGRVLFSGGIAMYTSQPNLFQMGPYTALQNYPWLGGYYAMTGPMGPPLLMRQESGELKLNWSEHLPGYALESSPSPTGPWAPVTTSTNSITLDAGTSGNQFFRLKQQSE
jgi:hypothetical protein